jgi:hypothetical protein
MRAGGLFSQQLSPASSKAKVESRVKAYGGMKDQWFEEWFIPQCKSSK